MTRPGPSSLLLAGWLTAAGMFVALPAVALPGAAPDAAPAAVAADQSAIQLGAYEALSGAESDWQRLSKRFPEILAGFKPTITSADLGSRGVFQRLRVGPFADQAAAKAACDALIAARQKCLVTKMAAVGDPGPAAAAPVAASEPTMSAPVPGEAKAEPAPAPASPVESPTGAADPVADAGIAAKVPQPKTVPAPEKMPTRAEDPAPAAANSTPAPPTRVEPKPQPAPALMAAVEPDKLPESKPVPPTAANRIEPSPATAPGPKPVTLAAVPTAAAKAAEPDKRAALPKPEALPKADTTAMAVSPRVRRNAPGSAVNQIATSSTPLVLEVNKGTLLRLPQPASTVFVADPDVADVQVKSPGLIYVFGKKAGETVLYAVDDHERVLLSTAITVSHNVSRLRQALRMLMPDANIEVASVDNSLVLTGTVKSASEAEDVRRLAARIAPDKGAVINQLQVAAPNQINLRVRIAEMSRSTLKNFGINLEGLLSIGGFAFGIATGNPVVAAGQFLTRSSIAGSNSTNNSLTGAFSNSHVNINGLIDALGTEGLISVLAEPNLTALSGETASFLVGGEFPIPVPQSNGNVTIEFKKFGVALSFTPTLAGGDRINMKVRPEVSQLSSVGAVQLNNFSIPALTLRETETTVELASGQSFAIAGLLQNNTQQDQSQLPGLGELPVLGALFRSDRFRRSETELVVIVTPYIVRPVSAKQMASPTDGFVPPNDVERIIGGANYRQQLPKRADVPRGGNGQSLIGPTGFVLE